MFEPAGLITKGATDITRIAKLLEFPGFAPSVGYTITDLDLTYIRNRATPVKVDATALSAVDDPHADNKAIELDGTNAPGLYRVDWPDAAFASGVDSVILVVNGAGLSTSSGIIQLVDVDFADTVRLGLTSLPNAAADAAGGLPVSDAGGLDVDTMDANVTAILADTDDIGIAGAGLTDLGGMSTGMKAEVQTEANDALVAQKLDHLVAAADGDDPANNSILAKLASESGDWSDFDKATDSLEAIQGNLQGIRGSGFLGASASLAAQASAAAIGGGTISTMSAEYDTLTGIGYLTRLITRIRELVDDPGVSAKYENSTLLGYVRDAWSQIMRELNQSRDNRTRARMDLTIPVDTHEVALPPVIGQFLELAKMDENDRPLWEVIPRNQFSPAGPGFHIEGPMLYLDPVWKAGETLRILYVPNGEAWLHEADAGSGSHSSTTGSNWVVHPVASSLTAGSLDTRPNAYAGYIIRFLEPDIVDQAGYKITMERVVTSSDPIERRIYFEPALDYEPNYSGTTTYEVVPIHTYLCEHLVALRVALLIARMNADKTRESGLTMEYQSVLRSVRLELSQLQQRTGKKMVRNVRRI